MTTDLDCNRWALEIMWGQQPRVSLKESDAWQTKTRNILIKMQIFGYRTQQWIKHNCAISVEKSMFFPNLTVRTLALHLHTNYAKAVTSQPHPYHKLRLDPLRIIIITYMKLLRTTKKKISGKCHAVSSLIICQHCWRCLPLLECPLYSQTTVTGSNRQPSWLQWGQKPDGGSLINAGILTGVFNMITITPLW